MNCRGFLSTFSVLSAVALAIGFLPACATKAVVDPRMTSAMVTHNVHGWTAAKIQNGQILDYRDIQHLVRAKMPASTVIAYLQSTEKSYQFSPGQLDSLRNLGAASQLIHYLNETKGFYTSNGSSYPSHQFYWTRLWDRSFARRLMSKSQFPLEKDMMDPAYEESLFSPFF